MPDLPRLRLVDKDDPALRTKSVPVAESEIPELAFCRFFILGFMRRKGGVGLAANQVGDTRRWFVCESHGLVINPEIINRGRDLIPSQEGCLSFPNQFRTMLRHRVVTMRYTDHEGKTKTVVLKAHEAVVAQHEIDHLDGVVIVDVGTVALPRCLL